MTEVNHAALVASVSANPCFMRFRNLDIGRALSVEDAMAVFSCFEEQRHGKGEMLYAAGGMSERAVHVILEGGVSVADASGNVFSTMHAGDVFGVFSFLDKRPHSATVTALEDLTVLRLPRGYFDLITVEDPDMGYRLMKFMFRLLSGMALKLEIEYAALREYALQSARPRAA